MENLLTVRELSELLKVHPNTIYRLCKKGSIPYVFIKGIGIRFGVEDIEKWVSRKKSLPVDKPLLIFQNSRDETSRSEEMAKRRRTPIGSVYQRKTKDGRVRWYYYFRFQGRTIRKVVPYAQNEGEAMEALMHAIRKAFDGELGRKEEKSITFKEFSSLYEENYAKPNKRSWKTADYYYIRKHYLKAFGSMLLGEITPFDVESFKAKLFNRGYSKSTINRLLAVLKRMFNLAIEWGYCKVNPVKKVKLFSEKDNLRERILTPEEEMRLISSCSENLRPIVVMALQTGMRKSEILKLKWENVNLRDRIIVVRNTKSGKPREVPINSILYNELVGLRLKGRSQYVFSNPETGKPLTSIRKSFEGACRRARIEGLRFHDLRHTFATRLIQAGTDIQTVKELLGHHSITITQRYTHSQMEVKKRAVEGLTLHTVCTREEGIHENPYQKIN